MHKRKTKKKKKAKRKPIRSSSFGELWKKVIHPKLMDFCKDLESKYAAVPQLSLSKYRYSVDYDGNADRRSRRTEFFPYKQLLKRISEAEEDLEDGETIGLPNTITVGSKIIFFGMLDGDRAVTNPGAGYRELEYNPTSFSITTAIETDNSWHAYLFQEMNYYEWVRWTSLAAVECTDIDYDWILYSFSRSAAVLRVCNREVDGCM